MKLKPLPNTVVHVPTEEEWDAMKKLVTGYGWTVKPTRPYLFMDVSGDPVGYDNGRYFYKQQGYRIITPEQFKKEQGLMKKELKDMEVGDVLIDEVCDERTVLEVLTQSFLPSLIDSPAITSASWLTFEEAEKAGWRFKDKPAPKKMTKASIEEALGYPVEIVEES
jgi:hypothetical protein